MITTTEKDTLIPEIMKEAKLTNLMTRNKYHVYGLKKEGNPLILIEYGVDYFDQSFVERLKHLKEFFKLNGLEVDHSDGSEVDRVDIGLRIDLRKHLNRNQMPLLAASILSTIIYCLEDRIDIEQMRKYKLSTIPTFEPRNEESELKAATGSPGTMCEYGWWDKKIEKQILNYMKNDSTLCRQDAIVKILETQAYA